jgi:hypothetical protein
VFADGSFIVYEPDGSGDGTLCLLVDNGKMILCDGTLRESETLAFHVTGVRQ